MTTPDPRTATFRWHSVGVSALLPTVLFSTGEGAIIPIIPVVASALGADLALAGLVAAMLMVGTLIGDIPSGALIARVGERVAMIGASALSIVGLMLAVVAPHPLVLAAAMLLVGVSGAIFGLARHAFMTSFVPISHRARALSTLGGTHRLGLLIGPFVGAAVIAVTGSAVSAFWVHVVASVAAAAVLLALRDPETAFGRSGRGAARAASADSPAAPPRAGLLATLAAKRGILLTLGLGSMMVSALRAARQVVLPLWGVSIGLDETTLSIIIGIAGAVDFSLFFAGGWIMDRFGRLWTAVPSMIGLGLGHLALAFTHETDARAAWFVGIAMFLSLANGIGAGILMTLGADLADPRDPAVFLGAWRFTNDTGGALAPLLVAGLTALVSLPFAVGALGVLGLGGAVVLRIYVPRHVPSQTRETRADPARP